MGIMKDIPNRIKLTERKDRYIISTVKSLDNRYGKYETAIIYEMFIGVNLDVVEGYETEEQAIKGHDKYAAMTEKELDKLESLEKGEGEIYDTNCKG